MGGRQSTHNNTQRNSQRHSIGSVDQATSNPSRIGSLFGGPSHNAQISSTPPDGGVIRRRRRRDRNDLLIEAHSLPAHLFPTFYADIKCPVCNKRIGSNEIESHLLACLAKPRVSYNEDVLKADAGECIICFDDMCAGEYIARLPCLCIYHKNCIDDWFQKNRCCPEHPDQIPTEITENASSSANLISDDIPERRGDNNEEVTNEALGAIAVEATLGNNETLNSLDTEPGIFVPQLELDDTQENITSIDDLPTEDSSDRESSSTSPDTLTSHVVQQSGSNKTSPIAVTKRVDTPHRTVVHVDDGSIHGSPTLFDEDEIAQLSDKIKTILVAESPRGQEVDNT